MDDLQDDQDDDPFAKKSGDNSEANDDGEIASEAEDGYDDPDEVDFDNDVGESEDEEIDSEEAFGDGDEDVFKKKGFTFRGRSKPLVKSSGMTMNGEASDDSHGEDIMRMSVEGSDEDTSSSTGEEAAYDDDSEMEDGDSNDNGQDGDDASVSDIASGEGTDETSPEGNEGGSFNRAALREIFAADQKSVVATISEATKADAAKGAAVKQQHSTFDALVGTRIQLQKALVAANSLPIVETSEDVTNEKERLAAAAQAAERAALTLLNSLNSLLSSVNEQSTGKSSKASQPKSDSKSNTKKRPFSATLSTPSSELSASITALSAPLKTRHRSTLTKWANKTQHTGSLPARSKLTGEPATQPLTSVLDSYLGGSSLERLVQRTQIPRSCAPLQQATANTKPSKIQTSAPNPSEDSLPIYDDADWYALLLRELIEHKKTYMSKPTPSTAPLASTSPFSKAAMTTTYSGLSAALSASASLHATKTHRANVDTKASKGRKMRYNVHEKLQNFMAPQEVGGWSRRQAEELFAGLFGRRVAGLGEEGGESGGEGMEDVEGGEEVEGLRLFGGR